MEEEAGSERPPRRNPCKKVLEDCVLLIVILFAIGVGVGGGSRDSSWKPYRDWTHVDRSGRRDVCPAGQDADCTVSGRQRGYR